MRRIFLLLLLAAILMQPVYAAQSLPLPPEAAEYLPEQTEDFGRGLWEILTKAAAALAPELRQAVISCVGVLAAVILCALFQVGDGTDKARTADILGAAAIAAMLLRPADALIQEAMATVRAISDYGKLLLPVMGSALASSGGASASAGLYFGTALFDSVLTSIVSGLLAPAIYLFLALAVGAAAIGDPLLGRFRDFFKGFITWGLKIVLYLFTGYMAITRVVSGTVDAAAIKAAKLTLSGMVPVVGGLLSDASETILVSASVVRSASGVAGMLAVLAMTAGPFLRLGVQYLTLKLTAALCAIAGNSAHTALTESFSQAMGLLLAMTGTGCLLQLISTVCMMKGVN